MLEMDEEGLAHPVFRRRVELAARPRSLTARDFAALRDRARAGGERVAVRLRDAKGRVVFRGGGAAGQWIRGEFAGQPADAGGFAIEGHRVREPRRFVTLRIPVEPGGELEVEAGRLSRLAIDELGATPLSGAASEQPMAAATAAGDPANRLDLLVMGDGYTAAQEADFLADAAQLEADFFADSPQAEYANFVNVTTLFVASSESGADHPPYDPDCPGNDDKTCCADAAAASDPLAGSYVNTAFGARYCSYNIFRLLVVHTSSVLSAASAAPDWDSIIVIVNDATYGGSGGSVSVASTHPSASEVVKHEFGHSFTDLADEYESPFPQFPSCSDLGGYSPCEANVTDETSPSQIKWEPWIDTATPVPSPENGGYGTEVGLFEGARYLSSGMYRPFDTECLMRFLHKDFDPVCSQAYVLKLYQGGWGNPSGGIDPIEPGSEDPPPGDVDTDLGPHSYSVDLLEPAGGPPLDVVWLLDGSPVAAGGASYDFDPPGPGDYELEIQVEDVTSLVHEDMVGTSLQSGRSWTVHAVPEPAVPVLLASGVALLAVLARTR